MFRGLKDHQRGPEIRNAPGITDQSGDRVLPPKEGRDRFLLKEGAKIKGKRRSNKGIFFPWACYIAETGQRRGKGKLAQPIESGEGGGELSLYEGRNFCCQVSLQRESQTKKRTTKRQRKKPRSAGTRRAEAGVFYSGEGVEGAKREPKRGEGVPWETESPSIMKLR